MNRRSLWAGALALMLAAAPAIAQPMFEKLTPLLVDLPGFTGGKAMGMTMATGDGGAMTTAQRLYEKEPASLDVMVMVGPMAAGALASLQTMVRVETSEGHVIAEEIDGFKLMKSYANGDKSGALVIGLGAEAAMTVGYKALSEDEAVAMARKLDWKALAAATK